MLALTRFGRSNTKRSDSAHSVKLPQSGPPSCISSTSDVQTSSCHRPTSADQLWPVFLPLVSDAYHHNNNNSNKKPRRQLGQRMHHPDQISGPSARLPAASSSTSSLDSFSQDAQGDFFPLPQSSRFSKARFPFHSEDPVELVEGAAKAEDSVDGAQDSTRLHKNRSLEWITVPSQGRAPSKGICAHTATRVGNALYIIAGCDSKGCLGTLRRLDMTTLLWTRIKPKLKDASEKVPKLRAHTATRVHDSIVIYGGGNGPQCEQSSTSPLFFLAFLYYFAEVPASLSQTTDPFGSSTPSQKCGTSRPCKATHRHLAEPTTPCSMRSATGYVISVAAMDERPYVAPALLDVLCLATECSRSQPAAQ